MERLCPHHTTKRGLCRNPPDVTGRGTVLVPLGSPGRRRHPVREEKYGYPFATLQNQRRFTYPLDRGARRRPVACDSGRALAVARPVLVKSVPTHPKRPFIVRALTARGPPIFKGALRAVESNRTVLRRGPLHRPPSVLGYGLGAATLAMRPNPAGGRGAAPLVKCETKKT